MNPKIIHKKVAIVLIALLMIIVFAACEGEEPSGHYGNNEDPPSGNGDIVEDISLSDEANANCVVNGIVRNVYFDRVGGLNVYFGAKKEVLAAVSDTEEGTFTFYIKTNEGNDPERTCDYISLDGALYDYNVLLRDSFGGNLQIEIVCAPRNSGINVYWLLDYGNKISFQQDGLPLPPGYLSRDQVVTVTQNGETVVNGVEFYVGDHLIGVQNNYGFGLPNIYPGTVITLKREGFSFVYRTSEGDLPLTAEKDGVVYENSFIAPTYSDPFPIKILAVCEVSVEEMLELLKSE